MDTSNMSPEEIAKLQKENCIFCKIIKGEIDSKKVYEDDKVVAILDINPATDGHVLVMPKEHYPILPLVPPEELSHMFKVTKYLVKAIKKGMPSINCSVFIANGQLAGQQSPHFLYHLIPEKKYDISESSFDKTKEIETALKQNVPALMQRMFPSEGQAQGATVESQKSLADVIENNEQLRKLIIEEPDKVKEMVDRSPDLKKLFQGVDIDMLSKKLKGLTEEKKEESKDDKKDDDKGGSNLDKISDMFLK